MGKLSEQEIRTIVQKASLLQKFQQSSSSINIDPFGEDLSGLYEITDDLNLPRAVVQEAFLELKGIPTSEPIVIDNYNFNSTEVIGFANGRIDQSLFKELKAHIEYHFNTQGKITYRPGKMSWKAMPVGPSRLIASSNSPEIDFEDFNGQTKITVKQSLKTVNKLLLPNMLLGLGAVMLFIVGLTESNSETAPMLIFSAILSFAAYFFARFVHKRRTKKKEDLKDLTDTLQKIIQRRFNAAALKDANSPEIVIPEKEADLNFSEVKKTGTKIR